MLIVSQLWSKGNISTGKKKKKALFSLQVNWIFGLSAKSVTTGASYWAWWFLWYQHLSFGDWAATCMIILYKPLQRRVFLIRTHWDCFTIRISESSCYCDADGVHSWDVQFRFFAWKLNLLAKGKLKKQWH